jgi:O-acetyl-ADP-ribose deacetylase (regulator of RNase III)
MDVTLVRCSAYELPSQQRVGAIVHDGAADLRLWTGPGADRDLQAVFGDDLQAALDTERQKAGLKVVPLGSVVRIYPGLLHCDFVAWVATRPPEPGTERHRAPDAGQLREAVLSVLEFVAARNVLRVAFPALGGGPSELDRAERLAVIVRAAHEYEERCLAARRPPIVEEVLVCEQLGSIVKEVQRRVARLARAVEPEPRRDVDDRSRRAPSAPRSKPAGGGAAGGGRRKKSQPMLAPDEVARMRVTAEPYSMRQTYIQGDWLLHPKFGVGRVEQVTPTGAIVVLFEDGAQRNMVHARA